MIYRYLPLMFSLLVLAGCGTNSTSIPVASATDATLGAAAPTPSTASAPSAASQPSAAPARSPAEMLADTARTDLAARLGVEAAKLTLVQTSAQEWPNSALGCAQPGSAYTQVIVPGYLFTFNDGQRDYAVHTSNAGRPLVWCDGGKAEQLGGDPVLAGQPAATAPVATVAASPNSLEGALAAAKQALSDATGVAVTAITMREGEATEWRNSSLGCPQPGMSYMQVITPGYRFVLEANSTSYNVNTNMQGYAIVCKPSK